MNHFNICFESGDKSASKALWDIWNEHPKLKLPGINNWLCGYSWAALRTNFNVGRLLFDAGLSNNHSIDYIFLTHGHSDHSASLYFNLYTPGKTIYVPNEIKEIVQQFLRLHFDLSDFDRREFDPAKAGYEVVGVSSGDQFEIVNNGKKTRVSAFGNTHSVPCLSFGIEEQKKALRPEYRGLPGQELGALRKSGVEIEDLTWQPCYAYVGDTDEEVYSLHPSLFQYPCLIVECTFLLEEDLEQARQTRHSHWRTLSPILLAHPDVLFVLYHFSTRYKKEDIERFFQQEREKEGAPLNFHAWTHS